MWNLFKTEDDLSERALSFIRTLCLRFCCFLLPTCKMTMKNSTPQAMGTLYLTMTITQPPNWPIRLTNTKSVAKILPQPHDMSIYSLCSFHWNHIRSPSSKNVEIKQRRATVGRMYFAFLVTCNQIFSIWWWLCQKKLQSPPKTFFRHVKTSFCDFLFFAIQPLLHPQKNHTLNNQLLHE